MVEEIKNITASSMPIKGTFVINKCELKPFKQKSGYFMSCELLDRTGSIKGVIWDNAEQFKRILKNKMIVDVVGEFSRYGDIPQVVIKTALEAKNYDIKDLVLSLDDSKIENMYKSLQGILANQIKDPICKSIWNIILEKYEKELKSCPGGVGAVHHNYLGGLLEHALSVMLLSRDYCTRNTGIVVNQDILLTGALLHDIGKIKAYRWGVAIEMSDMGRLMHHIPLGIEILYKIVEEYLDKEQDNPTLVQLKHIIVSHHGDDGMIKPMTQEAVIVAMADAMDALANHTSVWMKETANQREEENWTTFCQLTSRFYYQPKPVVMASEIPVAEKNVFVKKDKDSAY